MVSRSVMFSSYSHTAKCTSMQFSTQQTQHLLTVWFKCQHCLACHMLLLQEGKDWNVHLKIDISMNQQFKESQSNPYSRMKDICFWSHMALNWEMSEFIPFFSHWLLQHPNKVVPPWNISVIIRLKPKQHLKIYDMYSQLQIL